MATAQSSNCPAIPRRTLSASLAIVGTIVWTHALAAGLRAALGSSVSELAPASLGLTLGAVATALAGAFGRSRLAPAALRSALTGLVSAGVIGWLHRPALVPALALAAVGPVMAAIGVEFARRLPARLERAFAQSPKWAAAWAAVALLAVIQVGRLSTYMTDADSDWFLSTRHPFYAKHECANAYVFAAELNRRGESNVYDAKHYPGLNPQARPETEMVGMAPEDPFQYPPQFLLLPRLAIELTSDYGALRLLWFALNLSLCLAAVLALAVWVGGHVGTAAGLSTPVLLVSFPVLHDFQYGQFHFAAVALAVLGLLAIQRQRLRLGGVLLASSILAKLFPAVLLVPLAIQKRWRALAWTLGTGAALSALALAVLGSSPFQAFFEYHLPRLGDGSAFAFGEAWPEVADLVIAGNQGVHGIVHKLGAMGLAGADASLARLAGLLFFALVLGLAIFSARRVAASTRAEQAASWLALLGLASLASAGAWADYVPLTCVWLLVFLVPLASGQRLALAALLICAVLQITLVGTMPLGGASDPSWMMPLSLLGALAMLFTFVGALLPTPSLRTQACGRIGLAAALRGTLSPAHVDPRPSSGGRLRAAGRRDDPDPRLDRTQQLH